MENENAVNPAIKNEIPGTAQIRKISAVMSSMELLFLCRKLAVEGFEKKLWSVFSRVYEDKKGFGGEYDAAMDECVNDIISSDIPSELKLQLFTSFELPSDLLPDEKTIREWIDNCNLKRINIAGFFIARYSLQNSFYKEILNNKDLFKIVIKNIKADDVALFFETVITNENKETITGAVRMMENSKIKILPVSEDVMVKFAAAIFESKEVFFTTKLIYCIVFDVPKSMLPKGKDLDRILRISINYEEKIAKEFVAKYRLHFDVSNEAICKYYLNNKKAANEKNLVLKFATHLYRVESEDEKRMLLRGAFKRGGYFRMYAGCMQDGAVNEDKLHHFRYSDEDIKWCKNLPGLK